MWPNGSPYEGQLQATRVDLSLDELRTSEWLPVFVDYLQAEGGDATAGLFGITVGVEQAGGGSEAVEWVREQAGSYGVDWSGPVGEVLGGGQPDDDGEFLRAVVEEIDAVLGDWWEAFRSTMAELGADEVLQMLEQDQLEQQADEVLQMLEDDLDPNRQEIRYEDPVEPQRAQVSYNLRPVPQPEPTAPPEILPLDVEVAVRVSQAALKAAQDPGIELAFRQSGELLLIQGTNMSESDQMSFEILWEKLGLLGASEGTIQIRSRGRGLNPGEIYVDGGPDPATFKRALRVFSKKQISYQ